MTSSRLTFAGLSSMLRGETSGLTCLELCAGGGGTALGLEIAGFDHRLLAEIDRDCCRTLRRNRPGWRVAEADIARVDGHLITGQVDLISAGVPCQSHSRAGLAARPG